jgi:hypothetical protein
VSYPIAALAILISGVSATALASSNFTKSTTKTVSVPTAHRWTDTGISLSQGKKFSISARGIVSYNGGVTHVGPNGKNLSGDTNQGNFCLSVQYSAHAGTFARFPAQHVPCWSLIGKIGSTGMPIFIGKSFSAQAPVSGELFLGFNDQVLSDNQGSYSASITTH